MKRHEIHTLSKKAGFSSMKQELTTEVEQFINKKVNEGYEIVTVSFTYYEATELLCFITICK